MSLLNLMLSVSSGSVKNVNTQGEFDALTIEANDIIKLNGIFEGNLAINQNNVHISGGGIKGSNQITGWTSEGANIYSKVMTEPKWIYIDGQRPRLAKTQKYIVSSIPASNQIQLTSTPAIDPTGSKLVGFTTAFSCSREYTVIAHSAGLITLDRDHDFTGSTNIGTDEELWLLNKQSYFAQDYDWCYESGSLYIQLPTDPSNYTIKSVNQDVGINVTGSDCNVSGVTLSEYFESAINVNGNNLTVTGCNISKCREDAIRGMNQFTGLNITVNDISECGTAIIIANPTNTTISNNSIYDIGTDPNYGWIKDDSSVNNRNSTIGAGIFIVANLEEIAGPYANNFTIEKNVIYNTAYNGISTHAAYDGLITKNIVYDILQRFEDGGGIYTFFYRDAYPQLASGIEISYNFVYNIPDGWSNSGIYQDNRSGANNIHHNVVWDVLGKYSSWSNVGCTGQIWNDNTFYGGITATLLHEYDSDGTAGPATNVEINRNILIQTGNLDNLNLGGNVYGNGDNNYFVNPYYNRVGNSTDLAGLQSLYSQDANSTELTNYITAPGDPDNEILLITNPADSVLNGSAPAGTWKDVDGTITTNYTVSAWSSLLLLKDLP